MEIKDINIYYFYKENKIQIINLFRLVEKEITDNNYNVIDKENLFKDLLICLYNNSD